jgi:uncharacterized integral membrane protein
MVEWTAILHDVGVTSKQSNPLGGRIMDRGVIFFVLLVGIILLILLLVVLSGDETSGATLQSLYPALRGVFA